MNIIADNRIRKSIANRGGEAGAADTWTTVLIGFLLGRELHIDRNH
jgi:hypothetical protein